MIVTQQPKRFKILLIGDGCIDEYVYGICSRLNPEAPVPVLDYTRIERKPGMAANVNENLKAFDIDVTFLTNEENIIKTRYVDHKHNHQILRVDRQDTLASLDSFVIDKSFDAIVISDYNKGFISQERLFEIAEKAKCPVFIDTKKTELPDKENCFIKINEPEYKLLKNPPSNTIVTLGEKGAMFKGEIYPTEKVHVFDVVGAGDTFLAVLSYFYLLTGSIEKSIPYANKAASIAIQHTGTYILSKEDVQSLFEN